MKEKNQIDLWTFLETLVLKFQQGIYKPEDLTENELLFLRNRGEIAVEQYQEYCRDKIQLILG